jgi:hypothetical protein
MTGGMGRPSDAYRPRDPAANALYHVVRDHFETFRAHAAQLRDGEGLPGFVEQEFRDFLLCGWWRATSRGCACTRCRTERLVAFSCKGRGFCPSCGRRMVPPSRVVTSVMGVSAHWPEPSLDSGHQRHSSSEESSSPFNTAGIRLVELRR